MTGPGSSPSGPDLAEFYEYAIGLARTLRNTAGRGATKREEGEFAYAVEFLQRYDTEEARDAVVGDRPRDRGGDPAGPRDLPRVGAPGPVPQLVAPDLAALREKAEAVVAAEGEYMSGYEARRIEVSFENEWTPARCLAVLSLVDRLVAYSDHMASCPIAEKRPPGVCTCGYSALIDSLAGSPAANEETTDA